MASCWRNAVLALSLLTILHLANSSLIGIDFGTDWIEVALVKPRTFEVVLNEQSSRKTPAAVTFSRNGDLLLGTDAKNLITRQPDSVATGFFGLLGKSWGHPTIENDAIKPFYSYKLVNESGRYGFSVDENTILIPEELAAILLKYLKDFASKAAAMTVKDCVITVPPFFNQQQRQAVLDSAKLAGLNVLSLLNQDAAIGLHFAVERLFTSAPPSAASAEGEDEDGSDAANSTQFFIFDMGSAVTTVSFMNFKFTSDEKTKQQTGTLRVIDFAWDEKLGGRDFDRRLALHFVEMTKKLGGPDVSQQTNPRAFAKLMKEAQRVKEILSANSDSVVMVEGLTSDFDLKSSITREQFENLCTDLFERALVPLQTIIQRRNLTLPSEDITYVEIFGGGIRIPKLQQKIQETIGRDVDRHINGDEGAVLGAAFYAATQSSSFKKSKTINVKDFIPWGLTASIKSDSGQVDTTTEVFKANSRYGSKKSVTFSTNDNFTVHLQYDESANLPAGTTRDLGVFRVTGVPSIEQYNMVAKPKIHVTFRLNNHGMYVIERAEAEAVILLPPEPKKEAKKDVEDDETEAKTETQEEPAKTEEEAEEKEQEPLKRVHRVNLDVAATSNFAMSSAAFAASTQKLLDIQRRAELKKEKEREKNTLEAYIYETKEKLDTEDVQKVTTEQQREEFSTKLSEAADWLYGEGENTDAAEYRGKLKDLKTVGDKIFFRVSEMTERPKAVMQSLYTINITRTLLVNISDIKNITEEELHEVTEQLDELESWIETKLEEQSELQDYDDPVLTSRQINDKWAKVEKEVKKLLRKPEKKKPKPTTIETPESENTTTESTENNTETPSEEGSEQNQEEAEHEHSEEDGHPDHTHDEL